MSYVWEVAFKKFGSQSREVAKLKMVGTSVTLAVNVIKLRRFIVIPRNEESMCQYYNVMRFLRRDASFVSMTIATTILF